MSRPQDANFVEYRENSGKIYAVYLDKGKELWIESDLTTWDLESLQEIAEERQ